MRGKLEYPSGLIELVSVEVEMIDPEYRELWLGYDYTCPGGEYKSTMAIPITDSAGMAHHFFEGLVEEARRLSEIDGEYSEGPGFFLSNKSSTFFLIKNLCQQVINVFSMEGPLEENRLYIDLSTTGIHFKDPSKSLSGMDFDKRLKVFMNRAKEKISQGFYTLAADDLEKARALCSNSPIVYKFLGICHRELGHLDLALEMFLRAMDLDDKDKDTYLYLEETGFFLDDMEFCENILEEMLNLYPDDIRGLVELANVRYQMGRDYMSILDKAFSINNDETREVILQTFVFKRSKSQNPEPRLVSARDVSAMMGVPLETIKGLVKMNRIPARETGARGEFVFDKDELKAWMDVYNRYGLMNNEIERAKDKFNGHSDQGMALLT